MSNLLLKAYLLGYLVLFGSWIALVLNQVPGTTDLIDWIKLMLGVLTGHVFGAGNKV